jgi:hypothetical protein
MAELSGAKQIRITHPQCTARAGSCCEWKLDWS